MRKKTCHKYKFSISKLILAIVILICAFSFSHIVDRWTIPIQNEVTINQLSGGNTELIVRDSTNSFLINLRLWIVPIAGLIVIIMSGTEIKKYVMSIDN